MLQEIATPLAGLAMTDMNINKNAHPNRDERNARGTTLIPALAIQGLQALSRVRPTGLYSRSGNDERLRLSYSQEPYEGSFEEPHKIWEKPARCLSHPTNFRLQLRDDFQPIWLTRLSPRPGSLPAWTDLLVPIMAFVNFGYYTQCKSDWQSDLHEIAKRLQA